MRTDIPEVMEIELGKRVTGYLDIENSTWAYKMWFGTTRWWWDEESRSFVEETRPHMLRWAELNEKERNADGT